jgi:hypothetical protein
MEYNESKKNKKPGREEFKSDMADAVEKGVRGAKKGKRGGQKLKRQGKKTGKKGKGKYEDMSAKELYSLVKGKRDLILQKKNIPAKLPRGRQALIDICVNMKR